MERFEKLVNEEMSVIELSNKLQTLGCEDICDFGNWTEILKDGNVVVATDECGDNHIQIFFKITIESGEDEVVEATEIKITNIENY